MQPPLHEEEVMNAGTRPNVVSTGLAEPRNGHVAPAAASLALETQAKTEAPTEQSALRANVSTVVQVTLNRETVPAARALAIQATATPIRETVPVGASNATPTPTSPSSLFKSSAAVEFENQHLVIEHTLTGAVRKGPMRKNAAAFMKQNPDWRLVTKGSGCVVVRNRSRAKRPKINTERVITPAQPTIASSALVRGAPSTMSVSQQQVRGSGMPGATSIAKTKPRETLTIAAAARTQTPKTVSASAAFMAPPKQQKPKKTKQQVPEDFRRLPPQRVISIAYPQNCNLDTPLKKISGFAAVTKAKASNPASASPTHVEQSTMGQPPPSRVCEKMVSSSKASSGSDQPPRVSQKEFRPQEYDEYPIQDLLDQIMQLPNFLQSS